MGCWDSLFDGSDNSVIGKILGTPQEWQSDPLRSAMQAGSQQWQNDPQRNLNAVNPTLPPTGPGTGKTAQQAPQSSAQPYGLITGGDGTTLNGQFSPNAPPPTPPPTTNTAQPDITAPLTGPPIVPPGPPLNLLDSSGLPNAASAGAPGGAPGAPLNIAPSPSTNAVADASGNIVRVWPADATTQSQPQQPGMPLNIAPPGGAFNPSQAGAPNNLAPPGPQPQMASIMPNALPATAATPPPAAAMTGAPNLTTLGNGNLNMALGLTRPPDPFENAVVSGMAGLGRGLSAVGAMRPGANAAQDFAAGGGGRLG